MAKQDKKVKSPGADKNALPKREKPKSSGLLVPGVYRDQGYLVLALSEHEDSKGEFKIEYLLVSEGKRAEAFAPDFARSYPLHENVSPVALALNLIARAVEGLFDSSVHVYRRLIEMAMNKEELMKMSERSLAKEYSRVMKLQKAIGRIPAKSKEKYVDEMLSKLREEGELLSAPIGEEGITAASATAVGDGEKKGPQTSSTDTEKGIGMASKKRGKPLSGAAAKKKAEGKSNAKALYPPVTGVKNPFREGTMKAKAFDLFCKGGERAALITAIKKLGSTDATASSWLNAFRKVK